MALITDQRSLALLARFGLMPGILAVVAHKRRCRIWISRAFPHQMSLLPTRMTSILLWTIPSPVPDLPTAVTRSAICAPHNPSSSYS